MKKFLIRVLLFGLAFFILDKIFYIFLYTAPQLEADKRLELLLHGKINEELIVMGSSRGAYNIIASQIEKETGKSAYNISYAGSNVQFQLFLLKTLLKFNKKPKTIVLSIDNPYEFLSVESLGFRNDRLYPLEKYNYINEELIKQNDKSKLSWFFCLARINKNTLTFKKHTQSSDSPILTCGSMPFIKDLDNKTLIYNTTIERYPVEKELICKREAFLELQQICHSNSINLIYCFTPNFRVYNPTLEKRIKLLSYPENNIFCYNTKDRKYQNKDYFHDESHLNIKGAKLFTSELSKFINLKK